LFEPLAELISLITGRFHAHPFFKIGRKIGRPKNILKAGGFLPPAF
jgi:hypothetical protein